MYYITGERHLILCDSIGKYIRYMKQTKVIACPGININKLTHKLLNCEISLNADVIIVHVGTYDINNRSTTQILQQFEKLINFINRLNPNTYLIFSSILRRPVDLSYTISKVIDVNKGLKEFCFKYKLMFLFTFTSYK